MDKLVLHNETKVGNETVTHKKCVKSCDDYPGFIKIFGDCWRGNKTDKNSTDIPESNFTAELGQDLSLTWVPIVLSCVAALAFSFMLLVLFRYAIKYVIWIIMIGTVVFFAAIGVALMVGFFAFNGSRDEEKKSASIGLLIGSGIMFIIAMIVTCLVCCFKKRIEMVIQLFKEASRALADVPSVLFEPILTFVSLVITFFCTLYFTYIIMSAGTLQVIEDENGQFEKAEYRHNIGLSIAFWINFIGFIWFTQFVFGCQHFVIASTVVQWFFTRTKDKLDSPLFRSFGYLMVHIGSVCFGSIVITIVKILKMIVENAESQSRDGGNAFVKFIACCCSYIMELLEEILKYLVRNAYIIVAMDGTALIPSGRKAFNLLAKNLIDVIALNKVGDFVLFLARIFIVAISAFLCYELVNVSNTDLRSPNLL